MAQVRPLTLRLSLRAALHLDSIADYIALENPQAAHRVGIRIKSTFDLLCEYPGIGREGTEPGTREWVMRGLPYIVVYSATDTELSVLGVFHGAQEKRPI